MTANTTTFHFIGDAFLQGTRDNQGDSSVSDVDAVSLLLSHSVTTVLLLNHRIIGGSNPSVSFQIRKQGCHIIRFLCSLSMLLSLLVKDTIFIKCCGSHESGRAFLFSMTRKTDTTSMRRLFTWMKNVYLNKEPLVFIWHLAQEIAEIWCAVHKIRWSNHRRSDGMSSTVKKHTYTAHVWKCCILANKRLPN